MLRVDSSKPCKIVYAVCKHDFLGYLIEPHMVQLNPQGDFSLTYQRIFSHTAKEFSKHLTETDLKMIKILDETEQDHIITKNPFGLSSSSVKYLKRSSTRKCVPGLKNDYRKC
jgi:hypothetical protein